MRIAPGGARFPRLLKDFHITNFALIEQVVELERLFISGELKGLIAESHEIGIPFF